MEIREIKESDLQQIQSLQPQDWPNIIYYFELYIKSSFCFPICAVKSGKIVGVASAILNSGTGWLAHIIVSKEFRRQGIGYRLTEACMNTLDDKKCKTQLLIASKDGAMLYPKLGFKTEISYLYFQGNLTSYKSKYNIKPFKKENTESLLELDYQITAENRNLLTYEVIEKSMVITKKDDSNVLAFYLPILGNGAILSCSVELGLELLRYKHLFPNRKSAIPDKNSEAINYLIKSGFIKYNESGRMYVGEKLNWQPENIYCTIGGFYG